MGKIVPEIRDNFSLYRSLLTERKSLSTEVINISEVRANQRNFLVNDSVIARHINLTDDIFFITEVRVNNYKSFKFKLRCSKLSKTPFFRYDSDGVAHRIHDENIPLREQQIPTPHFNAYDEKGKPTAYLTDQLKDDNERQALEDINLCVAHFCNESNVRVNDEDFPSIEIMPGTLFLDPAKSDPNSGVQF